MDLSSGAGAGAGMDLSSGAGAGAGMDLGTGAGAGYGVNVGAGGEMTTSTTVTTTTHQYGLDLGAGAGAGAATSGLFVDGGMSSSGVVMGVGSGEVMGAEGGTDSTLNVTYSANTGELSGEGTDVAGFAFSSQTGAVEGTTTTTTTTTTQQYQYGSGFEGSSAGFEMNASAGLDMGSASAGFEMGGSSTGLEIGGGSTGGITMGFGASGEMAGATYSAGANAVDLNAMGVSSSQYGTTGTATTTTTTTVQHFTS